jgi:hypothetical protein
LGKRKCVTPQKLADILCIGNKILKNLMNALLN